jgi:hypothetical protein
LLTAVYLWVASGLAYAGAASYRREEVAGTVMLVAFLMMITAFLSLFVAVVSVTAHHWGLLAPWQNLLLMTVLLALGAGSYCLELVFLVAERRTGR